MLLIFMFHHFYLEDCKRPLGNILDLGDYILSELPIQEITNVPLFSEAWEIHESYEEIIAYCSPLCTWQGGIQVSH